MPAATFTHSVAVSADPEVLAAALQDEETWKGIGPIDDVWDATHDGPRLTGFRWNARAVGKTWEGTAHRVAKAEHPMRLDLDSAEIAGSISVDLEDANEGTQVTVTLAAQSKGMLAGMFWGVVADALRRGLERQVEAFAARF